MHFHVLGLGAIGHLVAHHLRRVLPLSNEITIIHKTPVRARNFLLHGGLVGIERDGINAFQKGFRSESFGQPSEPQIPLESTYSAVTQKGNPEVQAPWKITSLIVTTKAHQVTAALYSLLPRISSDATIVLLQNGMGVYEDLIERVFINKERRPHFILASNTHGVFIRNTYAAVHTGVGELQFGIVPDPAGRDFEAGFHDESIPEPERALSLMDIENPRGDPFSTRYRSLRETVAALVLMEQLNTSWKPISDIQIALRRKLVVNAVINPLTAIMNCRNGELLESKEALQIAKHICWESSRAFEAQYTAETQHWLEDLSRQGMDSEKVDVGRLPPGLKAESLYDEILRVAEATQGNISSMLSDNAAYNDASETSEDAL